MFGILLVRWSWKLIFVRIYFAELWKKNAKPAKKKIPAKAVDIVRRSDIDNSQLESKKKIRQLRENIISKEIDHPCIDDA